MDAIFLGHGLITLHALPVSIILVATFCYWHVCFSYFEYALLLEILSCMTKFECTKSINRGLQNVVYAYYHCHNFVRLLFFPNCMICLSKSRRFLLGPNFDPQNFDLDSTSYLYSISVLYFCYHICVVKPSLRLLTHKSYITKLSWLKLATV